MATLFLDAGGVLVHPNWARVAAALVAHGVAADEHALARADLLARHALDRTPGARATNDAGRGWLYFNLVLEKAGIPLTPEAEAALADLNAYHMTSNLWERVTPGAGEALRALRGLGLRLVVVSNANGTLHALFERLGLARHFDVLLDSWKEGVEKPDPRLFHIALERAGAAAPSTTHVGDLYHVDVQGARAAGLHAVLYDAGDLYPDADCPRVRSLSDLVRLFS